MHKMLNEMYEKKENNVDVQNEFSKEHIQKIESLKNIKQQKEKPAMQNKSSVPDKKTLPPPPPIPNNSGVNQKKKEEVKKQNKV